MPFTSSIQALISTHTNDAGHSVQSRMDWVNSVNYQYSTSTGVSGIFMVKMNALTGVEIAFQNQSGYPGSFHEYPIGLDASGLYINANSSFASQINPTTLAQIRSDDSGITFPQGTLSPITAPDNSTWQLITGLGTQVFWTNFGCLRTDVTPMTQWSLGAVSWGSLRSGMGCPGMPGTGIGYVISTDAITDTAASCNLFKITLNAITQTQTLLKNIVPTDIDGSWTKITCDGFFLDQTDGNLCICFFGNAGSNRDYIAKYNTVTGAQMWKSPIPSLGISGVGGGAMMAQSRILSQSYVLYVELSGGTNNFTTINTASGAVSTTTTGCGGLTGVNQCFDDVTGAICAEVGYTAGVNAPTQRNSTPSSYSGWSLIYAQPGIPPFQAILGSGYFIERMDNREWPAVENVWCVDCALQTSLPTFNATLTASSATGAGIPTGVTGLFGGQGYSAGTTAEILDPTGSGAGVSLTIASGIITGVTISGGTGYTYPQLVFNDPAQTGQGASADVTLDNSAIFQTNVATFNSGMVGSVIRMGGGVATITHYTGTQQVTANITTPIAQVLPNSGGIPIPQTAGNWSIAAPTSIVYGLMHLIGFTVVGVADGAVVTPRVVQPNGSVILDNPATLITLGLPFTPQFQSLYLDGGSPTIQGQRKKVAAVTVRLDASGVDGIQAGSNQPTGSAQSPQVQNVPWDDMDDLELRPDQGVPPYGSDTPPLFTGDTRAALKGGIDRPGQVALQQTLPLPMNITAIIPEGLEGDQPEQGYQPKPEREPRRPNPKGGGRGR